MRFLRFLLLFALGAGLALAFASQFSQSRRSGEIASPVAQPMMRSAGGASWSPAPLVSAPSPPEGEPEIELLHELGRQRGYASVVEFLNDEREHSLAYHFEQHGLDARFHPQGVTRTAESQDWSAIGVVAGAYQARQSVDPQNHQARLRQLEEMVLKQTLYDVLPMENASLEGKLLLAIESRLNQLSQYQRLSRETETLRSELPDRLTTAIDRALEARKWNRLWSSSIVAALGGMVLAVVGTIAEKAVSGALASRK